MDLYTNNENSKVAQAPPFPAKHAIRFLMRKLQSYVHIHKQTTHAYRWSPVKLKTFVSISACTCDIFLIYSKNVSQLSVEPNHFSKTFSWFTCQSKSIKNFLSCATAGKYNSMILRTYVVLNSSCNVSKITENY